MTHTHTRTRTCERAHSVGIGPSQRPLPDKTQHSQETNFHDTGRIRSSNPSKRRPQAYTLEFTLKVSTKIQAIADIASHKI